MFLTDVYPSLLQFLICDQIIFKERQIHLTDARYMKNKEKKKTEREGKYMCDLFYFQFDKQYISDCYSRMFL